MLWKELRAWADNDIALFVGMITVTHFVLYFGLGFLHLIAYDRGWFAQYKINPNDFPDRAKLAGVIRTSLVASLTSLPALLYFFVWPVFTRRGVERFMNDEGPSWLEMVRDLAICAFFADTTNYWIHRWMHENKFIYKHVHKVHHEFNITTAFAAHHSHWFETLCTAFTNFGGPFLVCPHALTYYAWVVIQDLKTVDNHGGYDFPYSPFPGCAARHDFHHSHNVGCYGNFTWLWDWIMKTDASYNAWKEKNVASPVKKAA